MKERVLPGTSYLRRMLLLCLSLAFLVLSIVLAAGLRMWTRNAAFTYKSLCLGILIQALLAGAFLGVASRFAPLEATTISLTGLMMVLEAGFRLLRQMLGR